MLLVSFMECVETWPIEKPEMFDLFLCLFLDSDLRILSNGLREDDFFISDDLFSLVVERVV